MKKMIVLLMMIFAVPQAFAKTVDVHVNGMVCAFCGQGITKKFSKRAEVKKVDVSMEDKVVKLELNEGQNIADEDIQVILKDSGFNVEKIERR